MITRKIGNSDLSVFPIGLGAMGMSEFYGAADEKNAIRTLHGAVEHGVNFIDTSDIYGVGGHNEKLLQKALSDRWDKIVLATKFGIVRDQQTGARLGLSGKAAYVKQSCENSLKRLGRDVIDLYYLHRVDPATPIEETVGAMAELVKEGKVRYIGLSEASGETIARANAVHPIAAVQTEYSMWSQDVEQTTLPTTRKSGISLVAYSPLGRGFLTGQIKKYEDLAADDFRRTLPRFEGANFNKNLDLVKAIEHIAAEKHCTLSQIALAWVLQQGDDIIPIPGTTKLENLLENIKAIDVKLDSKDLAQIETVMRGIVGTRYNEAGMNMLNK